MAGGRLPRLCDRVRRVIPFNRHLARCRSPFQRRRPTSNQGRPDRRRTAPPSMSMATGPATVPPSRLTAQAAYSPTGPTGSAIPGAFGQPGAYSPAPSQQGPWRAGVRPPADQAWISRYARPRSRALGAPTAQLVRDHATMRPYPSAQPYVPQAAPPATTP